MFMDSFCGTVAELLRKKGQKATASHVSKQEKSITMLILQTSRPFHELDHHLVKAFATATEIPPCCSLPGSTTRKLLRATAAFKIHMGAFAIN